MQATPAMVVACDTFGDHRAFELFNDLSAQGVDQIPFIQIGGGRNRDQLVQSIDCGMDDLIPDGRLDDQYVARLAFWIASEFKGLPQDLRRRALAALRADEEGRSLTSRLELNSEMMRDTLIKIQDELEEAGPEFGLRYIERMAFLARVSFLLIRSSENFEDFFRFPDLAYVISQGIQSPWRDQIHLLMSRFEEMSEDSRFVSSAQEPLSTSKIEPIKSIADF